jgi:hypothetical protein
LALQISGFTHPGPAGAASANRITKTGTGVVSGTHQNALAWLFVLNNKKASDPVLFVSFSRIHVPRQAVLPSA